jgi:hypothetical protein
MLGNNAVAFSRQFRQSGVAVSRFAAPAFLR